MIERLEPYVQQAEKDYPKAIAKVSENQPLLKVLFRVLSTRKDDSNNIFTTDRNKYLIELRDMLPMTKVEKQELYTKIMKQMHSSGKKQAEMFWKLEEIRMMVDNKCFVDAEKEISNFDEKSNDMADMKGRFWYIKGRFFRCKEYKEYTKASKCFWKSYQFNMNTDNVPESAIALNALGNTYFDMKDDEKALMYHKKAFDLLQSFLLNDLHPDLSVYEFNIGTIYLSKASKQLSICKCVTDDVKENLEKALQIFEKSMAKDEKMKTHRMPKYGNKLAEKAKALFYLSDNEEKRKEAIDIMKESLTIKVAPFTEPDKNKTLAIFKTGQTFINWREDVSNDKTIAKLLLKEAIHCFRKAEDEIKESESASLDGKDKTDFISVYEKIASQGLVSRKEAKLINSFCEDYKTGALFESFSSNESSSSNSDLNTSAITNQDTHDSDEGHYSCDDESYSGKGILSAETEKQHAAQFEKDFYLKLSAQTSKDMKKRRHSDSSESD
ncbi:uncharacterized protein LOC132740778 [Ruditapes philippinarum]|uniref:uncharacterized protein LOC132740778 n=1 Tax=Ruditapes philippinarum TaxID=129788 RepID=UPI00295ACA28|nr:uncharacterized protein LOC132740778 [Ruditapes philippinarum]